MDSQKNILLILADQLRTDTLGFRGCSPSPTPCIDRLAATGVSFDRCLTPNPLCTPARAAMFSGLYPHQIPARGDGQADMMMNGRTIGIRPAFTHALRKTGYYTAYAGKWHLGDEVLGEWFDRYEANSTEDYSRWCERQGFEDGWAFNDWQVRSDLPPHMSIPKPVMMKIDPGSHGDAWITGHALDLIRSRPKDRPFFLVCSFNGPHPPFKIPEPYFSMYDPSIIPVPPNFDPGPDKPAMNRTSYYHQIRDRFGTEWTQWQKSVAVYRGFVRLIDDQIGRILDCLQREELLHDTLVAFSSDHGEMMGQQGLWQKDVPYEEVIRVPLILSAPWIGQGLRSPMLSSLVDLMPTLLTEAGAKVPAGLAGLDLSPILYGNGSVDRGILFSESQPKGDWNRTVDWRLATDNRLKYIWNHGDMEELYDLESDPHEMRNLIHHSGSAPILREFRNALEIWMRRTGDPLADSFRETEANG